MARNILSSVKKYVPKTKGQWTMFGLGVVGTLAALAALNWYQGKPVFAMPSLSLPALPVLNQGMSPIF